MDTQTRPTKTISTPAGFTVELKTYITAGEFQAIQNCYMEGAKMKFNGREPVIEDFDPKTQTAATKVTIEQMIVSINGSKENIYNTYLNEMPKPDSDMIMAEIDELTGNKKKAEELQSQTSQQ